MYCIVTGGTEGIGKAVINRFAQEGFDIITCARNIEKLNYLKLDLENRYPIKVHVFRVDLSIKEEVLNFGSMVNALAVPEVLVNNAGVFLPGMIETEVDGALEHMINTNLYSAYHLTRSLMPEMKRLKKGYIFNMCSIASIKAYANGGSYGISKFVGEGYVRVLSEARRSEWSSLAISNVYGSVKIQKQGVVYRFWNDIQNGISPTVFGASVARDFIHIDDVVGALIKVIEKPVNCRINISSNTSTKLLDLLGEIINIMGSDTSPII